MLRRRVSPNSADRAATPLVSSTQLGQTEVTRMALGASSTVGEGGEGGGGALEAAGGAVDEDVEAGVALLDLGKEAADVVQADHVGAEGRGRGAELGELADGAVGVRLGAGVVDDDLGAEGGELEGDGAADAARAAGDEGGLAGEGPFGRLRTASRGCHRRILARRAPDATSRGPSARPEALEGRAASGPTRRPRRALR